MRRALLGLAVLALFCFWPEAAGAQATGASPQALERESGSVFGTILKVIIKWIFPVCAAYCFLFGVIGKGVKRGEWDMAAICTMAAVALALFPKMLTALFGVQL